MYILSDGHDSYEPPYLITNTCTCTLRRSLRGWTDNDACTMRKSVLIVPGVSILYHELLLEYVAHGCPRRKGKRGVCGTRSQAYSVFQCCLSSDTRQDLLLAVNLCCFSVASLRLFFSLCSSLFLSTAAIFQTNLDDIKATSDEFNRQRRYAS